MIPEIIFTTGITLYSILFAKPFKDMKGDIGLIYLNKDDLDNMTKEKRKKKIIRNNCFNGDTNSYGINSINRGIFNNVYGCNHNRAYLMSVIANFIHLPVICTIF